MREKGQILEYQADAPLLRLLICDILTIKEYPAAAGCCDATDELEQLCLAGAGASEQNVIVATSYLN